MGGLLLYVKLEMLVMPTPYLILVSSSVVLVWYMYTLVSFSINNEVLSKISLVLVIKTNTKKKKKNDKIEAFSISFD